MTTRRAFVAGLGSAAAWPLAARAQQTARPVIGILVAASPLSHARLVAVLVQRLRELGWAEGRTVAIEIRWAEGRSERFAELAAELERIPVMFERSPHGERSFCIPAD
jgi:putative ABC transport system substrate-binding protein